MPPKNKKNQETEDLGLMKAARFGRVKNTVSDLWFRHRSVVTDHTGIIVDGADYPSLMLTLTKYCQLTIFFLHELFLFQPSCPWVLLDFPMSENPL